MNDDDSKLEFELARKALQLRRNMLVQATGKGQGYLGQGFGLADFLAVLYFHELRHDPKNPQWPDRDRFLMSTGHYSIALWAVLAECGYIDHALLPSYGADGSILEMSTTQGLVPGVEMTGGSLGHGLGIAAGVALAARLQNGAWRTFVQISDGELQEGSTWEAATVASSLNLDGLTCFIDCNGVQADGPMVVNVEPVAGRFASFGWDTMEVDGNAIDQVLSACRWARVRRGRPKAVVLRTQPGSGVARLERREKAHFINVGADEWAAIAQELETENVQHA